jgi:DNA uptake protein ComE-like DNA-binding protein
MRKQHWTIGALFVAATLVTACSSPAAATSPPAASATLVAQGQSEPPAAPEADAPRADKLNLNTATREQFLTVPGVGDRMVREFFEYRPYVSIVQFRREIGKYVSAEQIAAYEQYVFVPVDPNNADAETLRQLPGVDASIAADLAAARPYATADAFLAKLGEHVSADQAAMARAYLATP